jgi:hypothetical protein
LHARFQIAERKACSFGPDARLLAPFPDVRRRKRDGLSPITQRDIMLIEHYNEKIRRRSVGRGRSARGDS